MLSDGQGCFAAVALAQRLHAPDDRGPRQPRDLPQFHLVNTVLGNLKRSFAGSLHSFKFDKYADSYLAGFAYRFNRRFDLKTLVAYLIVDVSSTSPSPLRAIRGAEDRC